MDISALHHRCGSSWKIDKALILLAANPGVLCMFIFIHLLVREKSFQSLQESIKTHYLFKLQCFTEAVVHLPIALFVLRPLSRLFAMARGFLPSQCQQGLIAQLQHAFPPTSQKKQMFD